MRVRLVVICQGVYDRLVDRDRPRPVVWQNKIDRQIDDDHFGREYL